MFITPSTLAASSTCNLNLLSSTGKRHRNRISSKDLLRFYGGLESCLKCNLHFVGFTYGRQNHRFGCLGILFLRQHKIEFVAHGVKAPGESKCYTSKLKQTFVSSKAVVAYDGHNNLASRVRRGRGEEFV